jgi:hypothetical protein
MDLHSRQLTLGSGIIPSIGLGTFTFFGKHVCKTFVNILVSDLSMLLEI